MGYVKKECQNRNSGDKDKAPESTKPQNCVASASSDGKALCIEAATITNRSRKQLCDAWMIDSAATWHMTSWRDWFCTYEPVSRDQYFKA